MGGGDVNLPTQNLTNELSQIYQGIANTAGPYANLSSILTPFYGQQALTNTQQGLFGFNASGAPGSVGAPVTPAGGFLGSPQPTAPAFPVAPSGQPGQVGPFPGAPAGQPTGGVSNPYGATAGAPPTGGGNTLFSPPQGGLIGLGPKNAFNDPYAGQVPPSETAGYHPGTLDLSTTALGTFGGPATGALLNSNPYLSDALNYSNLAMFDASNPLQSSDILKTLNAQSNQALASGGALSDQEQRDLRQSALASLGQGGITHGNTGIAVDLLSRDSAIRQRQQQAQQLAMGVQGLNTTQQGQELQRIGLAGQLGNTGASVASSAVTNPILQLLGLGNLNQNASPSTAIGDQSALFNPFQQIGQDVFNTNFNANANSQIANANSSAATNAGYLSLIGSIFGAASDKRLKKNIRKVGESPSGLPEVEWSYVTDDLNRIYHGTTAQALEKAGRSDAVLKDPVTGIKSVLYDVIDVDFREVSNPYSKLRKAA